MGAVIETEKLSRRFGKTKAVQDLTTTAPEGNVFAFIGPNGAGKTTTIKMLMNILEPSAGTATVLGTDSTRLGPREFSQIGYVSENQELPKWMTVGELMSYCRPMYETWDDEFCAKLLREFDLPADRKIRNLSRGMKMKAALISSLAYHPRVLVLDEPFAGLDSLVREEIVEGILEVTGEERWTVFIASHDIDEVERLADWIAILDKGKLQCCEEVSSLQGHFRQVEIVVEEQVRLPEPIPSQWLLPEQTARTIRFVDSSYTEAASDELIRALFPKIKQVMIRPMSLRSIFVALARTYRFSN